MSPHFDQKKFLRKKFSMPHRFQRIIKNFHGKKILVVGDLILDQYIKGSVSRISPEAPVPIVLQEGPLVYNPGGAANVANNLQSLGARVTVAGRIGKDSEGKMLVNSLRKEKLSPMEFLPTKEFQLL